MAVASFTITSAAAETPKEKLANDLAELQENAALLGLASNLGTVVGSEEFCGMILDQDAIAKWVAANVPPNRMDFPGQFQLMAMGQTGFNNAMTVSAKTAHCAAVVQSAKFFGFIK